MTDDTPAKRCTDPQCPEDNPQPLTAFWRKPGTADGLNSRCKTCAKRANRRQYLANREQRLVQANQHYAENREQVLEYKRDYHAGLRSRVHDHYGGRCTCCRATEDLCMDHIRSDGRQQRDDLYGRQNVSTEFYRWIIDNDFPEDLQILCRPCSSSKWNGERCRIAHV